MQFVLLKPILTVVPQLLRWVGFDYDGRGPLNDDGAIDWASPQLYFIIVANLSVGLAFYGLVSFYHATETELAWCDPWPKFLCIKGVVFMTFWQGVAISAMSGLGVVDAEQADTAQDFLICIEMLLAALAHFYIFPFQEWQQGYKEQQQISKAKSTQLRDTLALRDFMSDLGHLFEQPNDSKAAKQESPLRDDRLARVKLALQSSHVAAAADSVADATRFAYAPNSTHAKLSPALVGLSAEQFDKTPSPDLRVLRSDMEIRQWRSAEMAVDVPIPTTTFANDV